MEWQPDQSTLDLIRHLALQNSYQYDGKGQAGSVISRIMGSRADLRPHGKHIAPLVAMEVSKANNLAQSAGIGKIREILESEAPELLENYELPILADSEPDTNIGPDGFMQHDSVANYDWILKSKLYVGTESYMSVDSQILQQGYTKYPIRFVSEKVYKPLAWGMPFIILGNARTLLKIRQLGFKTFDGLIDESYDLEDDPKIRYDMVLNAIKSFIDSPPDSEKLLKICKFNLDLFYDTDFQLNQFSEMANSCVNNYYNFRRTVDNEFNQ